MIRVIFSFVVDSDPRFAFEGYHLARSLAKHSGGPRNIHVHFTPAVTQSIRRVFDELGCCLHEIQPFGDEKYCNKIAQLETLKRFDFDRVILLDTDMIALTDVRDFVATEAIQAKIVDLDNPSLAALKEIAAMAGLTTWPPEVETDTRCGRTSLGNCNGGFYVIPRSQLERVSLEWRRSALWLLDHDEPLTREGKEAHIDQVSMWLAIHTATLPFAPAPSNLNYYVHFSGPHFYFDPILPIALLHYHSTSLNVLGLIEPRARLNEIESDAIARANAQICAGFDNRVFWDLRYAHFPERGSGVGSRGSHREYKCQLLRQQGIETAASVLDVGCGDLEVVSELNLKNYLGLEQSETALEIARRKRPDWRFYANDMVADSEGIAEADWVLCLEVLIHQRNRKDYDTLVRLLAMKTRRVLVVSGYDNDTDEIRRNHMLFFYEPLLTSLIRTGRFVNIEKIGEHSDVSIYRCE